MTKPFVSRRTVLQGLSTAVALPWLESMGPMTSWGAETAPAKAATAPNRLAFLYVPNGKNMAEITQMKRNTVAPDAQAEQAIEMQLAGGAGVVLQKMSEQDIALIFKQPFTMVASDAGVQEINSNAVPHPRGFGNNARVLGVYVRERQYVSLEEAIRKMTSLPAQTFNLWERGVLRPGMAADVVVFDEKTVSDPATFQQPKQFAVGFAYVLVNGQVVIEKGQHTGAKSGQILHGLGHKR